MDAVRPGLLALKLLILFVVLGALTAGNAAFWDFYPCLGDPHFEVQGPQDTNCKVKPSLPGLCQVLCHDDARSEAFLQQFSARWGKVDPGSGRATAFQLTK